MDCDLHDRYARRDVPLSEAERNRIEQANYAWDQELAGKMAEWGTKLHQELWVMDLQQELIARFDREPER
jgi:hypothetical protein